MLNTKNLNLYDDELQKIEFELKKLKDKKLNLYLCVDIFYCHLLIFKIKANNKRLINKIKKIVEDYE